MKTNQPLFWLAIIFSASLVTGACAEKSAVVKDNFVNVRGQPNLVGEVITQLKKGEKITVLEEIAIEKPNPGEPAKWARIKMPENTPVWVSSAFVDQTNKVVSASRLNLRAGPGENYSVVGRLERGEKIKDIRIVDSWMEIETPAAAFAFIASEYLTISPDPNAASNVASAKTEPEPKPAAAAPPVVSNQTTETPAPKAEEKKTDIAQASPEVPKPGATNPPNVAAPTVTTETPTPNTTASALTPPAAAGSAPPSASESEPLPKRIVRREGIVRSTFSIQAPTYFELVSPGTRKTINYLHTDDPALKLKDFKGKKIVVKGEEGIDPRWPNVPVIEIESLEAAP
jgi:uncharacterized protein YgiM (DUF1202 family)